MKSGSTLRFLAAAAGFGALALTRAWAQDGAVPDPVIAPAAAVPPALPMVPVLSPAAAAFRSNLRAELATVSPGERTAIEAFFASRDSCAVLDRARHRSRGGPDRGARGKRRARPRSAAVRAGAVARPSTHPRTVPTSPPRSRRWSPTCATRPTFLPASWIRRRSTRTSAASRSGRRRACCSSWLGTDPLSDVLRSLGPSRPRLPAPGRREAAAGRLGADGELGAGSIERTDAASGRDRPADRRAAGAAGAARLRRAGRRGRGADVRRCAEGRWSGSRWTTGSPTTAWSGR